MRILSAQRPVWAGREARLMREGYFEQLSELYRKLETELPEQEGNPCGDCKACCTSDGLNQHNVTALELDYLETLAGPSQLNRFRTFLKRDGEIPICPYYDQGCSVYSHRPYSCRVFGHFRREGTEYPEVCVFRGQEKLFRLGEYKRAVPQADELVKLSRYYWAFRVQRDHLEESVHQAAGVEDSLGRALELLGEGDLENALQEMNSDSSDDPFTLYSKALMLEEAGHPALACQVLQQALEQAPQSPDLWHRLGCSLFALGERAASQQAFEKTVEFHPGHGQAWGLLAMHRLLNSDFLGAMEGFQKATELLPGHPLFTQRLDQAKAMAREVGLL